MMKIRRLKSHFPGPRGASTARNRELPETLFQYRRAAAAAGGRGQTVQAADQAAVCRCRATLRRNGILCSMGMPSLQELWGVQLDFMGFWTAAFLRVQGIV
eukprot:scaffold308776_cov19-Tisochrysis_lutea.AAC.1